jgi:Family of unknown function (DUF7009)
LYRDEVRVKLRIRGNSIRLRLSRTEVDRVASEGWVEDSTAFPAGAVLGYRLEVAASLAPSATLEGTVLSVAIPKPSLERWLAPDEVSIAAEQALPGGGTLKILVEKDFECLSPRDEDDSSDLFTNPAKA